MSTCTKKMEGFSNESAGGNKHDDDDDHIDFDSDSTRSPAADSSERPLLRSRGAGFVSGLINLKHHNQLAPEVQLLASGSESEATVARDTRGRRLNL